MGVTITALSLHSATEKNSNIKDTTTTSIPLRTGRRGRRPLHFRIYCKSTARATSGRPYSLFGQLPTAAKSLRSVLSFTSYLSTTLFSFANFSFLTPHSSLPLVHFALKSYQIDRININFHKNAKIH